VGSGDVGRVTDRWWIVIKDTLEGAEEDEVEDFRQALQKRKAENAEEVGCLAEVYEPD
jgi:hypothetical protein